MDSSTSPSKTPWPWRAVQLLAVALAAWTVGALYTLRVDPELAYDLHAHALKSAWAEMLDRENRPKFVVYGGSSCRTSIIGERMLLKHNLPVLNAGMGAGSGAKVLTQYALHFLRPGDTLIVALEPGLLTRDIEFESHGVKFALASGLPGLLRDPNHVNWPSALLSFRPGAYQLFTLLGKLALHRPLFRYPHSDLHPDGWQEVTARLPFAEADPEIDPAKITLSADGLAWLARLRASCNQRQVRVCYSLPWYYGPPDKQSAIRRQNAGILLQISSLLPVLKDPMLGTYSVRASFSDTPVHLTAEGAALRTDQLASQIKKWEMWSPQDLRALSP